MDRTRYQENLKKYVNNYDINEIKIYLKYVHTLHVAENCEEIAESLQLSLHDKDLVWKAGMLHDIGRFPQVAKYHTFDDSLSEDHAELSGKVLFQEGLIRMFDQEAEDDEILEKIIRLHNKYALPEDLSEHERMLCQIVRDADKIDIFRVNVEVGMDKIYNISMSEIKNTEITKNVYEQFLLKRSIPKNMNKTMGDKFLSHCALAWELVYPASRKLVKEQGYLEKMLNLSWNKPKTQNILRNAKGLLMEHINQ